MADKKEKTIIAEWIKNHPSSACSVGDIEEIPEERFKMLEELKCVIPFKEVTEKKEKE